MPKTIAVTGGKGGTGKSTVACLLAKRYVKQGKRVVLCDCDVECPNDHLLLGKGLKKAEKKIYAEFPRLDKEKCNKCGLCVKACKENAIFQKPGGYPVFLRELCSGCGACWQVCPQNAIEPQKEEIGEIFKNRIHEDLYLITGSSYPRIEETGPVVSETKKFAVSLADEKNADTVLIDTAAGTHCSVIRALLGVDLAFAVTEPTPMGAYDLNLILELCEKLGVSNSVILNQSDLGDKGKIKQIIKKFEAKVEEEIPYSEKLRKAYSEGQLLSFEF